MTGPTPLDCREVFARLEDFVDRELDPAELEQVEAHLHACTHCAPHFAFEQEVLEGVRRQVERIRAPAGLLDTILARLRAD